MKSFFLYFLFFIFISTTIVFGQSSWVKLFDGQTLTGWKQVAGKARFEVYHGTIVGISVPNSPNSFLATEAEYGDFVLEMEVLIDDTSFNSGVQFRSNVDPTANGGAGKVYGYQFELDPS